MNYADIKELDVQDGEGARVSIYVSGCHFHCKGCHNKEAWDFNYGKEFGKKEIDYIIDLMDNDYIEGLSILGGEPLELVNQKGLIPLVNKVKEKFPDKNIWCYTGYDFEKDILGNMYNKYDFTKNLLEKIDIIVDGEFVEDKKIIDLKFRGSYNQRKIDVKESLKTNTLVQLNFGDEQRYKDKIKQTKIIWISDYTKNSNQELEPIYIANNNAYATEEKRQNKEQSIETIVTKDILKTVAKGIG